MKSNVQMVKVLVADLVNEEGREKVSAYLASITDDIEDLDKLDIIIALGMAKDSIGRLRNMHWQLGTVIR